MLKCALALFMLSVILVACGKYEDGPKFSLHTKKARISGKWKLDKYTVNGTDYTTSYQALLGSGFVIEYKKDGTYATTGGNGTDNGTWEFSGDVNLTTKSSAANSTASTVEILKLKNKELWIKDASNSSLVAESHWVAD